MSLPNIRKISFRPYEVVKANVDHILVNPVCDLVSRGDGEIVNYLWPHSEVNFKIKPDTDLSSPYYVTNEFDPSIVFGSTGPNNLYRIDMYDKSDSAIRDYGALTVVVDDGGEDDISTHDYHSSTGFYPFGGAPALVDTSLLTTVHTPDIPGRYTEYHGLFEVNDGTPSNSVYFVHLAYVDGVTSIVDSRVSFWITRKDDDGNFVYSDANGLTPEKSIVDLLPDSPVPSDITVYDFSGVPPNSYISVSVESGSKFEVNASIMMGPFNFDNE